MCPYCVHKTASRSAGTENIRKTPEKLGYRTLRKYCFMSGVWEDGLPDSPWLSAGFGVLESVISVLPGLVDSISWLVSMRPCPYCLHGCRILPVHVSMKRLHCRVNDEHCGMD